MNFVRGRYFGYAGGISFGGLMLFGSVYISFVYKSLRLSCILFCIAYIFMLVYALLSTSRINLIYHFWFAFTQTFAWFSADLTYIQICGYGMLTTTNAPINAILNISYWKYFLYFGLLALFLLAIALSRYFYSRYKIRQRNDDNMPNVQHILKVVFAVIIFVVIYVIAKSVAKHMSDVSSVVFTTIAFLVIQTFSFFIVRFARGVAEESKIKQNLPKTKNESLWL